jgi:phospholipid transport system transporter-binding protein
MLMLPEAVTLHHASDTLRMLSQALPRDGDAAALTLDASALRDFDTSALAVLLECKRLATASGRGFAVRGAPAKLVALARLYGVDELLTLRQPEEAAQPAT